MVDPMKQDEYLEALGFTPKEIRRAERRASSKRRRFWNFIGMVIGGWLIAAIVLAGFLIPTALVVVLWRVIF